MTAESKSIPLIYALSVETRKPYVVLRKSYKPYMGDVLSAETLSITTGEPQMLYLDEKDIDLVRGKRVAIVDDVISTGSTLQAMQLLVQKANAKVAPKQRSSLKANAPSGRISFRWDICRYLLISSLGSINCPGWQICLARICI